MAHHVLMGELDDLDALHVPKDADGVDETALLFPRQVDLGDVAGDDGPAPLAKAGQEHLHLLNGAILGFVQDDVGVVEGPAPHVGEGRHLDGSPLHQIPVGLHAEELLQGVVEGPKVGVHLVLQVAGEEAQLLPRLHGRPGQDDLIHFLILESQHRHGHGQVRLARARGAHAEDQLILLQSLDVLLLAQGLALDLLAPGGERHHVAHDLGDQLRVPLPGEVHRIADAAPVDRLPLALHGQELFQDRPAEGGVLRLPLDADAVPVHGDEGARLLLEDGDVFVQDAEQARGVLHAVKFDPFRFDLHEILTISPLCIRYFPLWSPHRRRRASRPFPRCSGRS